MMKQLEKRHALHTIRGATTGVLRLKVLRRPGGTIRAEEARFRVTRLYAEP
jgi:hypothetical protein